VLDMHDSYASDMKWSMMHKVSKSKYKISNYFVTIPGSLVFILYKYYFKSLLFLH